MNNNAFERGLLLIFLVLFEMMILVVIANYNSIPPHTWIGGFVYRWMEALCMPEYKGFDRIFLFMNWGLILFFIAQSYFLNRLLKGKH